MKKGTFHGLSYYFARGLLCCHYQVFVWGSYFSTKSFSCENPLKNDLLLFLLFYMEGGSFECYTSGFGVWMDWAFTFFSASRSEGSAVGLVQFKSVFFTCL